MEYQNPVFIVGFPNSGMTLLGAVLEKGERAFCLPETHFFSRILPAIMVDGCDGTGREKLESMVESCRPEADREDRSLRFIETTAFHSHHLDEILKTCPSARFINLVRDPRDAVSSMITPETCNTETINRHAAEWNETVHTVARFASNHPDKLVSARYEDLVAHPEFVMKKLCEFIDLEFHPEMTAQFLSGYIACSIPDSEVLSSEGSEYANVSGKLGVWQERLTIEQAASIEITTGVLLQRYNYRSLKDMVSTKGKIPGGNGREQESKLVTIGYFPMFETLDELRDTYNRIRWYLPEESGCRIELFADQNIFPNGKIDPEELKSPDYMMEFEGSAGNIAVKPVDQSFSLKSLEDSHLVMIWKKVENISDLEARLKAMGKQVLRLDSEDQASFAYYNYLTILERMLPARWKEKARMEASGRLRSVAQALKGNFQVAYIFGTGPSLNSSLDMDFSDGVRIICNSIVKNQDLLAHIRPHFIVAADCVYHFGCSKYADTYRKDLVKAVQSTGAYFVFPEEFRALIYLKLPEIRSRCIPVPIIPAKEFNLSLIERFWVASVDNVLNMLMIPLASSVAGEVRIIGCDGRKADDNDYWKHDSESQYGSLMQSAKACHPELFANVSYKGYFDHHCDLVEKAFATGESQGIRYLSLTPSVTPALHKRESLAAINNKDDRVSGTGSYRRAIAKKAVEKKNLVIDGVIFQLQANRPLGISRIWQNLIPELSAAYPEYNITLLTRTGFSSGIPGMNEREIEPYRVDSNGGFDNDEKMLGAVCAEIGADVFVSTYFTHVPGVKNILMIYDMIPEIMGFDLSQPEWVAKKRAVERADGFIAISGSTRNDLTHLAGIRRSRTRVAYCGISDTFRPASRDEIQALQKKYGIRAPFYLLVGNRGLYKNSFSFFRAFRTMTGRDKLQVLAVGGEQNSIVGSEFAGDINIQAVPWLPDHELRAAYSSSLALVYLSKYEGFGLPVLEAMACGCPVITTPASSLPEVGGASVIYVNPDSPEEIKFALGRVLKKDVRIGLAVAGIERAAQFSWRNMAGKVGEMISETGTSDADVDAGAGPEPLVSAIVSTYDSERFIRGCLEDLEAQTLGDRLEIIVVDTGSTQNERKVVEEFQERYDNIIYIRTEEREGIYAAWNRGIKVARGKYITNSNTDDRHRVDALERLAGALESQRDVALAYANVFITEKENETFCSHTRSGVYRWRDFDPHQLVYGCYIGPQPMWRRSLHEEYGYFDESYKSAGDWEFWLRLAEREKFHHLDMFLGLYLKSPTSAQYRNRDLTVAEEKKVMSLYLDRYREKFGKVLQPTS